MELKTENFMIDFKEVFKKNQWGSSESVSGLGSELKHTEVLRKELQRVLKQYDIKTFLDIPCGDLNWIRLVDFSDIRYVGGDIVDDIIDICKCISNREFLKLDLTKDLLPRSDMIFCRDCLVHLNFEDGVKAINNIKHSGSTFFASTTFPNIKVNKEINGMWRPINLSIEPYNLGEPVEIINENYTGDGGMWMDKSIGIWKINWYDISQD